MLQSLPDDHILQSFFRCWHKTDIATDASNVRLREQGDNRLFTPN